MVVGRTRSRVAFSMARLCRHRIGLSSPPRLTNRGVLPSLPAQTPAVSSPRRRPVHAQATVPRNHERRDGGPGGPARPPRPAYPHPLLPPAHPPPLPHPPLHHRRLH